jgi:DNA-binding MarR family transcriptional regulator
MTEADERPPAETQATAADLRVLLGRLTRRLRVETAPNDLTWPQKVVLIHLERDGPATVSALARTEAVRPQSMSATVAGLEAAGLVRGAPDPGDRRQILFSLTPACVEMIEVGRAAREDWLMRAIHARLTPDERQALPDAIRLLARLVD